MQILYFIPTMYKHMTPRYNLIVYFESNFINNNKNENRVFKEKILPFFFPFNNVKLIYF